MGKIPPTKKLPWWTTTEKLLLKCYHISAVLHTRHFQLDLSTTECMPSGSEVLAVWNPLPCIRWRDGMDKYRI